MPEPPYPDEVPVYTIVEQNPAPDGWEGRSVRVVRYVVSNTRRHYLRRVESTTLEAERELRVSGAEYADTNQIMSDAVHAADETIKEYLRVNKPEWEGCLRDTPERRGYGMFLFIDDVVCASRDDEPLLGRFDRSYSFSFDRPRLSDWGGRTRCVWVERVSVVERRDTDKHRSMRELRITVRDDAISASVEHREMPHITFPIAPDFCQTMATQQPLTVSTEEERVAMEALRESLTENEWRRYLTRGFILVRGSSGKRYQIFRDKWHTKVWDKGKVVSEICARISGAVPPTDNVIAFKAMIEADEGQFERIGNVYRMEAA